MAGANLNNIFKECLKWLHTINPIKSSNPILRSTANIHDFASFLQDGVVLCYLLTNLKSDSIDLNQVALNTKKKQPLCIHNAELFLDACTKHFDLKKKDLFEADDLFYGENLDKIINVISLISQSPLAMNKGIQSFFVSAKKRSNDSVYYSNIKDLMENEYKTLYDDDDYEDTFDCHSDEMLQSLVKQLRKNSLQPVCKTQREHILEELLSTEKIYIEGLNKIIQIFMKPIEIQISYEHHSIIFFKITTLFEIHSDLLLAMQSYDMIDVSKSLIDFKEKFLVYGDYCCNLPKAMKLIDTLTVSNITFQQALLDCEEKAFSCKFKLKDTITLPLQRILKYKLLLENLVKHTTCREEFTNVHEACLEMKDLNEYLNEVKRDHEIMEIINSEQNQIDGLPVADLKEYGHLINHERLKIRYSNDSTFKDRYVFLFDLILLICKVNKNQKYFYEKILNLENAVCENVLKDKQALFSFTTNPYSEKSETTMFQTKCFELRNYWVKILVSAIEAIEPNYKNKDSKSLLFRKASFDGVKKCDVCGRLLKGLFFQGYRCQISGQMVHKECIPKAGEQMSLTSIKKNSLLTSGDIPTSQNSLKRLIPLPPKQAPDKPAYLQMMGQRIYVNDTDMDRHPWFGGMMNRECATLYLSEMPDGAYMVRLRETRFTHRDYALSVVCNKQISHMIIEQKDRKFFFSASTTFISVLNLITHYQMNSLEPIFPAVKTSLQIPYQIAVPHVIGKAKVLYDFNPESEAELFLRAGAVVDIVSKPMDGYGWWKGFFDNKIGYFPKNFVQEIE